MSLSLTQLAAIMPHLDATQAERYLPLLNEALAEFEIDETPHRLAAFLAQLAHESGELRWWEEFADGTGYDLTRNPNLARKLGNTQVGDGPRYKGRGPIQLTGRANYRAASAALGLPLELHPDKAKEPEVGFRTAGWFWKSRNLSALADAGNFDGITRLINGGNNGAEHRRRYWERAKRVLGVTP